MLEDGNLRASKCPLESSETAAHRKQSHNIALPSCTALVKVAGAADGSNASVTRQASRSKTMSRR